MLFFVCFFERRDLGSKGPNKSVLFLHYLCTIEAIPGANNKDQPIKNQCLTRAGVVTKRRPTSSMQETTLCRDRFPTAVGAAVSSDSSQQWTILLLLMPRVALRVSTTNCASCTICR